MTHSPQKFDFDLRLRITVVGVGGAGGNAVNNMIKSKLEGVEFIASNTDAQALSGSLASAKLQLGRKITQGLGAGSKPDVGRAAAEESLQEIMEGIEGSNMVFITAGMGGGTGTGAAPVIARTAREMGILTIGVTTKPFHFEGTHRMRTAERGIEELQQYVDTLIVIPNQNLFRIASEKTTFADAFKMADDVLYSGVRGVTDLMVMPGLINLDFADIRAVMSEMGKAMMGTGEAEGERRAVQAAEAAIANPLLEDTSMKGARGVLINITGGYDMTLFEVDEAANRIREEVDPEANIIFGSTFDERMNGKMRVSVVATGRENPIAHAPRNPSILPLREEQGTVNFFSRASGLSSGVFAPNIGKAPAAEEVHPSVPSIGVPLSAATSTPAGVFTSEEVPPSVDRPGPLKIEKKEGAPPRKRNPSLFERLTGVGRLKTQLLASENQSTLAVGGAPTAQPLEQPARGETSVSVEQQPTISVNAPYNDLDIPAFLRRRS